MIQKALLATGVGVLLLSWDFKLRLVVEALLTCWYQLLGPFLFIR